VRFELIADERDARRPWTEVIGDDGAIRGLHSVTLMVNDALPTVEFMTGALGYTIVGREGDRTRLSAGANVPGHVIDVVQDASAPRAVNGIGTVHHVAMAIGSDEEQVRLRSDLIALGAGVTDVRDRVYFRSIYFREPGGVLFEVATTAPGFAVDEAPAALGQVLKLPPWEEAHRGSIERQLATISA
jgi:glyoxalase family protein